MEDKRPGGRRFDEEGRPIGHWPTKRELARLRADEKRYCGSGVFKKETKHGHHSDPVHMGGNPDQPLVEMSSNAHDELHSSLGSFLRVRGIVAIGSCDANIRRYGRDRLLIMLAMFYLYEGPNGGAKHSVVAQRFFELHPNIKEQACALVRAENEAGRAFGPAPTYLQFLRHYYGTDADERPSGDGTHPSAR